VHPENLVAEKDEIYKIISHIAGKKPLWIGKIVIKLQILNNDILKRDYILCIPIVLKFNIFISYA